MCKTKYQQNETLKSILICIGLVDLVLQHKILGNRVCILTSVVIAMDYFFKCQKSTLNFENNISTCQGIFLFTTKLDLLTP